jgi:hypothetical protein
MGFKDVGLERVDWIDLVQDANKWLTLVKVVI